jgi:hypothetical protein
MDPAVKITKAARKTLIRQNRQAGGKIINQQKEGKMKGNLLITITGTLLLVFGWTLTGLCGETTTTDPAQAYGAYVDDYIAKCEAKADLLDARSVNIRKIALRSIVKGGFVKSNRDQMIEYLVVKNVPLNAHRIQYHLNQLFARSVHPDQVYARLLREVSAQ